MTRRIRYAPIALCFALFLPPAHPAPAKLRIAYIGLELDGSWSSIKALQSEPEAHLVAVADPHRDLLDRAKAATPEGTKLYTDYVRMLDEIKPDAVLATVPNHEHLAVTKACAERRIHLWFQKPMAATAAEAREMARLARESGILLMTSYHTMFAAPIQAVTATVEAGDAGTVERLIMRNAFNVSKVLSPTYMAQFLDPSRHGGGALMDQATYGIHYAAYLLGRPNTVTAIAKTLHPRNGLSMEDEAWVILDYPKATAVVHGAWWAQPDIGPGAGELTITGTKGVIVRNLERVTIQRGADRLSGVAADKEPHPLPSPQIPREMSGGVAHFIDCLRNHKPLHRAFAPGLNVLVAEIVDAAYESIRAGRKITLP